MGDWLPDFFSPAVLVSLVITLLCGYVFSPFLANLIISKEKLQSLGQKRVYIHTFLGSTLHAVIAFSYNTFLLAQGDLGKDKLFTMTSSGITSLHITMGYILGDTLICILDPYLRTVISNFIHHFAMLAGMAMCLHYELFLFFVVYRFLSELSTPFVNWRALAYEFGDKKGKWYIVASLSMMVSFFLCRIMVIPWHSYALFSVIFSPQAAVVPWYLKVYMEVNFVAFDILNIFWFYKIIRGACKFFFGGGKRR